MKGRTAAKLASLTIPILLLLAYIRLAAAQESARTDGKPQSVTILPGDSWTALAWRLNIPTAGLLAEQGVVNPLRWPAIGSTIELAGLPQRNGRFLRPTNGGLLALAAANNRNPWTIAAQNDLPHPYRPLLAAPLFLTGGGRPPRELPSGLDTLDLSRGPIYPGSAFALIAETGGRAATTARLEQNPLNFSYQDGKIIATGATGAFQGPGQLLLTILRPGSPLWEQPLTLAERSWTWEQITFDNAAVLDQEAIRLERERLQFIWDQVTPWPLWQGSFTEPINDYLEISSRYGARRSVNGGPYATYHEGVDFSAYAGTGVYAPAAGKVVLAETLAIRGGAVIIDHGLGLHTGYYHLSQIHVSSGLLVDAGDLIGEVGSTGRSTGNHLHWDLLVGRIWVDPLDWLDKDIASWLSPPAVPNRIGGPSAT